MQLGGRRSGNIEDRRGMGPGLIGGGIGTIVLILLALFFGVDPSMLINMGDDPVSAGGPPPADDRTADFIATVLGHTEDTWSEIFRGEGRSYREPKLVLFSGAVNSACGFGQAAMGPFYCPPDQKVYLDTSFFKELRDRFHAPGDFAQAYVIAHEIGHHVQNLLGISDRVHAFQQRAGKAEANQASVRLELQADCFAGVWAKHTEQRQRFLDPGDIDEAIAAASMIGDDKLQMESRGYIVPESFTHGTAEQRSRWFNKGFEGGTTPSCNTFDVANP